MLRLVILILALGTGGIAAWLAYTEMSRDPDDVVEPREEPAPVQDHRILVAATEIRLGTEVSAANLEWRVWPEDGVSEAYIQQSLRPDAASDLAGRRSRGRFVAGEPILESKLVDGNAGFLAALLDAGQRAVAVRISAESTAGGFILPGDRVDILYTGSTNGAEPGTRTLIESVEILAIDQTTSETDGESQAVLGRTATLRVDAGQARSLKAAETTGDLTLVLRSSKDSGVSAMVEAAAPRPDQTSIRVRRGGTAETVTLQ